jgi:hypothetical protein
MRMAVYRFFLLLSLTLLIATAPSHAIEDDIFLDYLDTGYSEGLLSYEQGKVYLMLRVRTSDLLGFYGPPKSKKQKKKAKKIDAWFQNPEQLISFTKTDIKRVILLDAQFNFEDEMINSENKEENEPKNYHEFVCEYEIFLNSKEESLEMSFHLFETFDAIKEIRLVILENDNETLIKLNSEKYKIKL